MLEPPLAMAATPSFAPLVTVVIATRNRAEMARKAIESALDQTFRDLEVVVVDDGSFPPFAETGNDSRVSIVRLSESQGVSAARNFGLAHARGEWVTFLDDDDELVPEMVLVSLQAATRSELPRPVAVVSGLEIVGTGGLTEFVRLPTSLAKGSDYFLERSPKGTSFTVGNTLFVPRNVLVRIGGFDERLRSAVHSELFLRLNAVCSIEGVPKVTYRIQRHGGEHLHNNALARARAMETTEVKHRGAFQRHRHRHARYLGEMGMWYLKAGEWRPAVRATTRAIFIDPLSWRVLRSLLISLAGPAVLHAYRSVRVWADRLRSR